MDRKATDKSPTAASPGRRFLMFPLTRIVVGSAFVIVGVAVPQLLLSALAELLELDGPVHASWAGALLIVPSVVSAYFLFVRVIERRPVAELSRRLFAAEIGIGWALGAALFLATAGLLIASGVLEITGTGEPVVLATALVGSLGPAFFEELLFRGVLFRILEQALGSWIALVGSALVFGGLHLVNPDATLQGAAAIALEAGLMLGAAYMLTRRLWLAIGIHAAWNYLQGGVFGISVSGTGAIGYLKSELAGPGLLSGGKFGAEGSVFAVGVCLAAFVVMLLLARRRGHLVAPRWQRR
jgi:membrane protease YdiL (CAAX protease family)